MTICHWQRPADSDPGGGGGGTALGEDGEQYIIEIDEVDWEQRFGCD